MKAPARRFPLLPRKKSNDKSAYGHALIVAGSRRMAGAAVLSTSAALRSGAGLTTAAVPEGIAAALARKLPPEVMLLPLKQTPSGSIAARAVGEVLHYAAQRKVNAVAVGPGLSTDAGTMRFARELVLQAPAPVVVDADGLNAFRGCGKLLAKSKADRILTPHAREFERLFGGPVPADGARRLALAQNASRRSAAVVVLKGHRTIVCAGRRLFINSTGNPGLAKGGSGDVLTGVIAAFLAQGLGVFEAAAWAAYFHGRAADLAARKTGEMSLTASDVIGYLPKAFMR
jgi:NAD(P)H-hydrate epimerase